MSIILPWIYSPLSPSLRIILHNPYQMSRFLKNILLKQPCTRQQYILHYKGNESNKKTLTFQFPYKPRFLLTKGRAMSSNHTAKATTISLIYNDITTPSFLLPLGRPPATIYSYITPCHIAGSLKHTHIHAQKSKVLPILSLISSAVNTPGRGVVHSWYVFRCFLL